MTRTAAPQLKWTRRPPLIIRKLTRSRLPGSPRSFPGETLLLHFAGVTQVKRLSEFIRDERGAELAEYAVGTAILVAVAIIVYKVLGNAVNDKMNSTANEIKN